MNKSVVLHGPQGSGKTAIADRLARHLGLFNVVDDWNVQNARLSELRRSHNTLYVTHADDLATYAASVGLQVISMENALRLLHVKMPEQEALDTATISDRARMFSELDQRTVSARIFASQFHQLAKASGWYTDLKTGLPLVRNRGEMLALIHSEISEALEGERKNKMDDHLPHRRAAEVELADALIRIFDYAGYCGYDVIGAAVEKAVYNANREDHKPENRAADGGKAF